MSNLDFKDSLLYRVKLKVVESTMLTTVKDITLFQLKKQANFEFTPGPRKKLE